MVNLELFGALSLIMSTEAAVLRNAVIYRDFVCGIRLIVIEGISTIRIGYETYISHIFSYISMSKII